MSLADARPPIRTRDIAKSFIKIFSLWLVILIDSEIDGIIGQASRRLLRGRTEKSGKQSVERII